MDFNWDHLGEDNEEELDEGEYKFQWGSKDGLIFLIDCTESMFRKDADENESPFELCIKCAKCVIQNKIISSDKDLLGIVFFGTELGLPGAEVVLELEDLLKEPNNNNFKKNFGHSSDFSLSDGLSICSNMFSNCTQKLGFKRVLLFTNNDEPHKHSSHLQRQAAAKVEDLHQNGINIELMHINQNDHDFDVNVFYKDLLFTDDYDDDDDDDRAIIPDPSEKFEELLTRVRSKDHKKRALSRVHFSLGEGIEFSIGIYKLVRTCDKPSPIKLYQKTNEEIKTVTKTFLSETVEILMPQDVKKCQTYAGKRICFEQEETTEMKHFDKPGIKLMGFKPRNYIKPYFHIKPATFIYPDESTIQGSITMFTALLKKCLDHNVVAICQYIPRKNTPPRFVALIPQDQLLDEHKVQVTPPGFHVIFLPFADDFRKLNLNKTLPKANEEQIEKAKEVIRKLTFKKFSCDSFENPSLQTHYVNVEAIALDRDQVEEITDYTLPNTETMDKKARKLISEFKELVFPEDYIPGQKHKPGGGAGAASKRAKLDSIDIDVEAEAKAGRIARLTVPILKEYIKQKNIKTTSTKKADLIDAIAAHLGL
ncbi:hypothetical protein LSH36_639g02004 [Paralvinella palmiformis]|uniref:DNA helicase n=1 Tax=Paralvinella palmiformis TaxID=53620 RepID=A0AAD9J4J7_9ANNE|nr:hypothetical protein LSH36_639g02004 [Paralvinella palmiformis]